MIEDPLNPWSSWERWFAWHPVKLESGERKWLCFVERFETLQVYSMAPYIVTKHKYRNVQ